MSDDLLPLRDKRIAFVGRLGGVNKREAHRLVRDAGGDTVDPLDARADVIVVGADELPLADYDDLLNEDACERAARGRLEVITETQLWERLGLMDDDANVRQLYTPAMLADLLDVPMAIIRRWIRRRLIVPTREVHRLPYFDFQEVRTAQNLAQLLAGGASPATVERKLEQLARYLPDVERPLAQLSVIIEGSQLLLRQGAGLIEPGGQLRIDFESLERQRLDVVSNEPPATVRLDEPVDIAFSTPEELCGCAAALEDEGELDGAIDAYRMALAIGGPSAEINFQLAELLYRRSDASAARERYYMAIELDDEYVEARHNLGCLLAETGQLELAAAAFEGALSFHPDYPDAHFHLASTLDELRRNSEAETHWRTFLELAPNSPWAESARDRIR